MRSEPKPGSITITKSNGVEREIVVTIRSPGRAVIARIPIDQFTDVLFGRSDMPCLVSERVGRFHGVRSGSDDAAG